MSGRILTAMMTASAAAVLIAACLRADDQTPLAESTARDDLPGNFAALGYTARIEF